MPSPTPRCACAAPNSRNNGFETGGPARAAIWCSSSLAAGVCAARSGDEDLDVRPARHADASPTAAVGLERRVRLSDQPERGRAVRHGAGLVALVCRPVDRGRRGHLRLALLRSAPPATGCSPSPWPSSRPAFSAISTIGSACRGWSGRQADPATCPAQSVHAVRDFIHVMIGRWPWPTFNLADSSLVCGAAMLVWHAFFVKPEAKPESEAASEGLPAVRS